MYLRLKLRYTAPQDPKNRLEESQWEHLQTLLTWANPDAEQLLGVIFLLAVRGIGKYKALTRQLPTNYQRPEHAVRYILNHYPNCMPSIDSMSMQMLQMANNVLELQEFFNFAQMIQGENVPENLDRLQRYMQARRGGPVEILHTLSAGFHEWLGWRSWIQVHDGP